MHASTAAGRRNSYFQLLCLLFLGLVYAIFCQAQPTTSTKQGEPATAGQRSITFLLKDHRYVHSVALAGTFNDWNTQSTPMTRKGADWSASIKLTPGTYRYKFVVDKDRWTVDPENSQIEDDGNGHINSVLIVTANPAPSIRRLGPASFHRRVSVGTHKLYINCEGALHKGVPVVVMDSGLGNSSESWLGIQPKVAEFARVCIYDRAGLGNSDPSTRPPTSRQIVADLHRLLAGSAVGKSLVLVGHSFGGINVRTYASMYPKEILGMVLVDSTHEEQFARMEAVIPEEIKKQFPPAAFVLAGPEKIEWNETIEQTRKANWHADIPLIVLTAANAQPGGVGGLAPKFEEIRQELQQDLVHRSARGKHIVATRSGHFIHHDEPELVLSAIREVVSQTSKRK